MKTGQKIWRLEGPGAFLVELYLENETEVALHRFSQSFPHCSARLARAADFRHPKALRRDTIGLVPTLGPAHRLAVCPGYPLTGRDASEVGGGTKPLRHLEEQLQELETLLRNGAAGDPAPATVTEEEMEDSFSEVSSDDETGQLDLCLGKGSQNVSLQLRAAVGGGTGARLWTGGILLAEWLLHATKDGLRLKGKQVLELGAGAAALPSIVAARYGGAKHVLATDGLEEVVEQMRQNVAQNAPLVQCSLLPWLTAGRRRYPKKEQFDIVLFADGIYTERGALLLADAVTALLRPKGLLIGALPDLRAGIASFEEDLQTAGGGARRGAQAVSRPPAAAVPSTRDGPLGTWHRAHGAPRGARGARGARGGAGAARGPSRDDAPGTSSWKP